MNPAEYDAWYDSPRGSWVGETEFQLLRHLLDAKPGDNILDVGCGTGWFTRRFSMLSELDVTGVDPDSAWLAYAKARDARSNISRVTAAHYLLRIRVLNAWSL